ncbi:hypothetical protein CYMTET_31771 [Cymbomonas tetramitiformis]|uniref:Uncharacterized protein n=1 Tax=Cymbomonas tetramitiformis TaxID=36881 RepID=A0AAE0FGG9_9CHLO|nr:hypothetical protein CYMTET_31771 [Cymbomonas tetramitiformis]
MEAEALQRAAPILRVNHQRRLLVEGKGYTAEDSPEDDVDELVESEAEADVRLEAMGPQELGELLAVGEGIINFIDDELGALRRPNRSGDSHGGVRVEFRRSGRPRHWSRAAAQRRHGDDGVGKLISSGAGGCGRRRTGGIAPSTAGNPKTAAKRHGTVGGHVRDNVASDDADANALE